LRKSWSTARLLMPKSNFAASRWSWRPLAIIGGLGAFLLVVLFALLASGLLITEGRRAGQLLSVSDLGCDTVLGEVELDDLLSGAGPVPCASWNIGTGVQGYVWRAPHPRAVLLLQHGFGEYAERYVRQHNRLIPHLLAAGITVYAFDMWGHGHSAGARAVTDLRAAVRDHLAARRLIEREELPVFVLGHSLGAFVTASSVARDQDGLSGIILMSAPMPEGRGPIVRGYINLLATVAPGRGAPLPAPDPSSGSRIPEEVEVALQDPLSFHDDLTNLVAATTLAVASENWALFPDWRVPTLILHGTADLRTDPMGSRRLFETIASTDKTLRLVQGARHSLLNDADRDEVLAVILGWLEARLPAREDSGSRDPA
jgi:acylglycerol lipase